MSESQLSVVSCSMAEVTNPLPLSRLGLPIGCTDGRRRSMSERPNWQPGGRASSLHSASSTVLSHTRLVYSLAREPNT